MRWQPTGPASCALELGDGHFISYNAMTMPSPLDFILMNSDNVGRPETAFILPDASKPSGNRFLILFGDFREDFEKAWNEGGVEACKALWTFHAEHRADCSDSLNDTRALQ